MSGIEELTVQVDRREADRLFKEAADRRHDQPDGRLLQWLPPARPGSTAERIGSLASTAFAVFCIVGGLSMMLGMALIPAAGVSLLTFAALRVFMNVG